jgi:hypothetical protein
MNEGLMNKKPDQQEDDLREEYDFSEAKRGRYADRYAEGSNVVVLDPDVAAVYADSESVNRTLREVAGLDSPKSDS